MEARAPKVQAMYEAVISYLETETDIESLTVAEITRRAGIGKGTAYEYFSNKEEIIAGALFEQMNSLCTGTMNHIRKQQTFGEKIFGTLTEMENRESEKKCMVKAMRVMGEDSLLGQIMKRLIEENQNNNCFPRDVISYLVEQGIKEIPREQEAAFTTHYSREFLIYSISGKFLAYALYLYGKCRPATDKETMKQLLYEEIMNQFTV